MTILYICFPTFFQLPDKYNNSCVAFLEKIFIDFTTFMVKKELLLHKGSVKMDEYYGMF